MDEPGAGAVSIERGSAEDVDALRELWLELHHHHQVVAPQSGAPTGVARRGSRSRWLVLARGDAR